MRSGPLAGASKKVAIRIVGDPVGLIRRVGVTVPGIDERLSGRVGLLGATLAIDVRQRSRDNVDHDGAGVRVPRKLCAGLDRVPDDDGVATGHRR